MKREKKRGHESCITSLVSGAVYSRWECDIGFETRPSSFAIYLSRIVCGFGGDARLRFHDVTALRQITLSNCFLNTLFNGGHAALPLASGTLTLNGIKEVLKLSE